MTTTIEIVVNGEDHRCSSGTTVAALLERMEVFEARIAVELNRSILPKDRYSMTELNPGDRVEIVTFVGGG